MSWLFVNIPESGLVPRGYGMAWRRWDTLTCVCSPIPLHLIFRLARDAYFRFMWLWGPAKWERLLQDASINGFAARREKLRQ